MSENSLQKNKVKKPAQLDKNVSQVSDFNQWLMGGIEELSQDFYKIIPKEVSYQYIDRLKKDGWLETTWDYMEALRAFRLYFIIYEYDNQLMKALLNAKAAKHDNEIKETLRFILRDFSKSTVELHKTLSDVLEKAGLSKVANKGLASPFSSIYESLMAKVRNDENTDNSVFSFEMRLNAEKRKNLEANPEQKSIFDKNNDITEAESKELFENVETAE
ncbi:MAG: hypothetical protein KBG36_00275 [Candidatus Marinimicrobia bacterium]|nr:hypothetical protein [Candidatus Neomarinimicrobiota bacterium]